jgi:hypothetical protein
MEGYTIQPERLDLTIPPQTDRQQVLTIKSAGNSIMDLSALPFIEIELLGSYSYDTIVYEMPAPKKLFLAWKQILPELSGAGKIMSAQFENPDTAGFTSLLIPEYIINESNWYGPEDCLLHFQLARDKRFLFLVALIEDDQLIMGEGNEGDLLYVDFEEANGGSCRLTIYPDPLKSMLRTGDQNGILAKDVRLISEVKKDSLIKIMLKVPIKKITSSDCSFRFNIGYRDQDNDPARKTSTLYWKPPWGSDKDYQFSGTFVLENHLF